MASMHPCNECSVQQEKERGSENKRKGWSRTNKARRRKDLERVDRNSTPERRGGLFLHTENAICCWGWNGMGGGDAPSSDSTTKCCTFPHNEGTKAFRRSFSFFRRNFFKGPSRMWEVTRVDKGERAPSPPPTLADIFQRTREKEETTLKLMMTRGERERAAFTCSPLKKDGRWRPSSRSSPAICATIWSLSFLSFVPLFAEFSRLRWRIQTTPQFPYSSFV